MKKYKGWIGGIGLLLLSKAKWLVAILKIGKFSTLISMFLSLGAYAVFYGWSFAFAIIYLIFVHEMGHLVAAKIKKLKTSPAIFIPFLGAAIGLKEKPKDAKTEAFVAYGGPLAGLLSIIPAIGLYVLTGNPYWGLVIQLGALLNLFNLFPVSPLDGGRIVTVLSTKFWFLGLVGIFVFLFLSPDPILILIFIFGLFTWWNRVREGYQLKEMSEALRLLHANQAQVMEIKQAFINFEAVDDAYSIYDKNVYVHDLLMKLKKEIPVPPKKRFFFPYFQDEEKIQHAMNVKQIAYINALYGAIASREPIEILHSLENELEKERVRLQKAVDDLTNYYVADVKTKWIVLVCYLVLAGVLALLLVYGMNILG